MYFHIDWNEMNSLTHSGQVRGGSWNCGTQRRGHSCVVSWAWIRRIFDGRRRRRRLCGSDSCPSLHDRRCCRCCYCSGRWRSQVTVRSSFKLIGIGGQIMIWFKSWLNHVWWFDIGEKDLIWKYADLIYNYLIRFAITWFDLRFEQITDWIDMNCSKFIEFHMIKKYQPTTNRYFVRIKLNYVDVTIWHADRNCLYSFYYLDVLCICVTGLKLFYSSGTPSSFNLKLKCDLWFDLIWGKWFVIWGCDLSFDLCFGASEVFWHTGAL